MPKCPDPRCRREMRYSSDASSLTRNVYLCFDSSHSSPMRVEKKSGLSWALTGAKMAVMVSLTGIPDPSDLPDLIDAAKDFFSDGTS